MSAIISLLIGSITFILAFTLFRGVTWRTGPKSSSDLATRLIPILRRIWTPGFVQRWWATNEVQKQLRQVGIPWTAQEFAAIRWVAASMTVSLVLIANWTAGFSLLSGFLAALISAAAIFGPGIWLKLSVEQRRTDIDLGLADFLDRLTLALKAGLGFEIALRRSAATFPGRLGAELRRSDRQLKRGMLRSAALDELVERNPSDDLRAFVTTVKQADRLGTSLADSLGVQKDLLRTRRRRRAQEASRRLPILIVFPLVFFFLPALMLIYLAPPLLFLFLNR
jgi:tight adherence protein C